MAGPAESWTAAGQAEARGDYVAIVKLLRPLAEQGDTAAQYSVGLLYDTGQSGKRDHAEAAKWYRIAAEQGFDRAQYYLGYIYYHDTALQDYGEAMKSFRKAADQGTAMAQYSGGGSAHCARRPGLMSLLAPSLETRQRATLRSGVTLKTRAFSAMSRIRKRAVSGLPS
jgi:TPR repeat protein